jgi:hypothetical protein
MLKLTEEWMTWGQVEGVPCEGVIVNVIEDRTVDDLLGGESRRPMGKW